MLDTTGSSFKFNTVCPDDIVSLAESCRLIFNIETECQRSLNVSKAFDESSLFLQTSVWNTMTAECIQIYHHHTINFLIDKPRGCHILTAACILCTK